MKNKLYRIRKDVETKISSYDDAFFADNWYPTFYIKILCCTIRFLQDAVYVSTTKLMEKHGVITREECILFLEENIGGEK